MLRAAATHFCESVEGKCHDVSHATGVVGFKITYFHKLIHQPFDNKHRLSAHEKLSFKLTNFTCVTQGTSQTGSKHNFPFPTDYRSYFVHSRVPWGPPEGARLWRRIAKE